MFKEAPVAGETSKNDIRSVQNYTTRGLCTNDFQIWRARRGKTADAEVRRDAAGRCHDFT